LKRCAAALTTRLVRDGYVNSRVYVRNTPEPGWLEVVLGELVEIRIRSSDPALERRIRQRLKPLLGKALNLTRLEQELVDLRRLPGVGQIKGNMGRLGTDVSQAVLNLTVDPGASPWQGDFSIRNDGNAGSGEWRSLGVTLKNDLLTPGDTLLLVGELNADQQAELGATIASISYTAPLTEQLKLTGSFGYSRRNLVEAEAELRNLSVRQFQGYGQLEWFFKDSSSERWSAFAGISGNRNDNFLSGSAIQPDAPGGWKQTGYVRVGSSYGANQGRFSWNASAYGLQGMASFSNDLQLKELGREGIAPGEARALGGSLNLNWFISPSVLFSLRGAGQVAFNELTSDMGFSLGSDTGLKGLPGSYVSGDSGYVWATELTWTFWTNRKMALQLIPFIGSGAVESQRDSGYFSDTVGSAGVLMRWLANSNWNLELGWISPFATEERPYWENWLLGSGVYTKLQYRF
jgi:hemolysin activation/secretion protein